MARMIPQIIESETKSSAEKKLFRLFKEMPDTDNWTIIHSVGIANHKTQIMGEVDYIVIMPEYGVFALEVKGGTIEFIDGEWYSTDRNGCRHSIKNPCNEAKDGIFSLLQYIKSENLELSNNIVFGFGVVFPDSSFHGRDYLIPDLDEAQIADADDMRDIKSYLEKLGKFWKNKYNTRDFNRQMADSVLRLLRPNFSAKITLVTHIKNIENNLIALTDKQRVVFDGLQDNDRCLIYGGAGTGKTVLAIDYAKKQAEFGKNIKFFCYNLKLAEYLRRNLSDFPNIECYSFTEYMKEISKREFGEEIEKKEDENRKKFYSEILPEYFVLAVEELQEPKADILIVDEAQDLLTKEYLEAFDVVLNGGLNKGQWYFFLDGDKQNLFHSSRVYEDAKNLLNEKYGFGTYRLSDNCRNSGAIIAKINKYFGTEIKYNLDRNDGLDVVVKTYKTDDDQSQILAELLKELSIQGILNREIVLLSPYDFSSSVVKQLPAKDVTKDFYDRKGKYFFSTIQGFKGLENEIVVLVDLDKLDLKFMRELLYVGMTRAKAALYIIISEKSKRKLEEGRLRG